ncbi:MAG TPA: hypothetical protein VHO01_01180 [Jatrophihabitans sp.]|nr:hypothetical protein [Jatrophihabitans sp.]
MSDDEQLVTSDEPAQAAVASTAAADGSLAPSSGMNHIQLAALSGVLAGALAIGAAIGPVATLVAVALVQVVLVPSWVLGNDLPGRIGALALGLLASAGADAAVMHWHSSGYSPLLGVLAVAVPLMFAHQLTRGVVRTRVVESLAGITVLIIAGVAAAGLIVLRYEADGRTITLAVTGALGLALVAAHLTDAVLPSPRFDPSMDRGLPAVVVGVVAGGVVGYLVSRHLIDFAGGRSAFVGAAVGAVACLISIGASFADPDAAQLRSGATDETRGTVAGDAEAGTAVELPDAEPELPPRQPSARLARLRPAGAAALTVALTIPAAYVLTNALTG